MKDTKKETVKNGITELVFILDRSGSMRGLENDTIGGFNSLIKKQKDIDGKCFVTTVLFDNSIDTIHDRVDLNEIPEMTDKDYFVRGCTALIDAIGQTVDHISVIHKYARPEDVPEHTLFVITTDGMENSSRKYTADKVRKMVSAKEELGWEFLFIGANIDAVETAKAYGISSENAVDYKADKKGTNILYEAVACAAGSIRSKGCMDSSWRTAIDEDTAERV